jgi:hypothetical protein
MPTFRVALLLLCLPFASILAQVDPVPPPMEHKIPEIQLAPAPQEMPVEAEAEPEPERTLPGYTRARARVRAQADISGAHGELLLDAATAPSSGVLLQSFSSTPDIFMQLGTSTSSSGFKILDANDLPVFTVRGDGYAILRKDQVGHTIFEINNANPGSTGGAASAQLRFFEGGTVKTYLASMGSGTTQGWGGANAFQIVNVANAPMLFGTNGAERMRIHASGAVTIGDLTSQAKFFVVNSVPNSRAMYAYNLANINTTVGQNDTGLLVDSINIVSAGQTNTSGVIGAQVGAWNFGPGTVQYVTGGTFVGGNYYTYNGSVVNAFGLQAAVESGNGGTVTHGYGVLIHDTEAVNDYGIYAVGADDTNVLMGATGIGTATPSQKLVVFGNEDAGTIAQVENTTTGTGAHAAFRTTSSLAQASYVSHGNRDASLVRYGIALAGWNEIINNTGNGQIIGTQLNTPLVFGTSNLERVRVLGNGNVGIGTAAPAAKLHVAGDMIVTGNITGAKVIGAVYQDLAEWVPATKDMAPGTVVVLNLDKTNEVMPSSKRYDTAVAGVVSEAPGIILGIGDASKEQIATTGRVKVRVDARTAAVRVGDLLVTSDIPGTAMKSEPLDISGRQFHQPGTIIGKALEPLADGVGEILVLLSMQ